MFQFKHNVKYSSITRWSESFGGTNLLSKLVLAHGYTVSVQSFWSFLFSITDNIICCTTFHTYHPWSYACITSINKKIVSMCTAGYGLAYQVWKNKPCTVVQLLSISRTKEDQQMELGIPKYNTDICYNKTLQSKSEDWTLCKLYTSC